MWLLLRRLVARCGPETLLWCRCEALLRRGAGGSPGSGWSRLLHCGGRVRLWLDRLREWLCGLRLRLAVAGLGIGRVPLLRLVLLGSTRVLLATASGLLPGCRLGVGLPLRRAVTSVRLTRRRLSKPGGLRHPVAGLRRLAVPLRRRRLRAIPLLRVTRLRPVLRWLPWARVTVGRRYRCAHSVSR